MNSRGRRFAAFAMVLAALVAVIGLAPRAALAAEGDVAKIGDKGYQTVEGALKDADQGTIVLLADASDIVVPKGTSATIDLNGRTVSAGSSHAITNNGTLTIVGSGTVDGGNDSGEGAVYTAPDATTVLNGGKYTGSMWYVIKNLGTMTISDGVVLEQKHAGSSAIDNGYYGNPGNDCGVTYPASANVSLTITGGTFSGGMNVVKNDDFGTLFISGGRFSNTNGPAVLNWNKTIISDGTFTVNAQYGVLANGYLNDKADAGQLTITGGTFTAAEGGALFSYPENALDGGNTDIAGGTFDGPLVIEDRKGEYSSLPEISGGTFSQAPDQAYLADGFTVFENADGTASAVPEEDIFTVTFVDGEKKATVEVVDGTAVTAQPITDQPGYKVYWALDGKEFDFATPVTGDITLTAAKTLLPPALTVESDSPAIVGDKATISVAAESDAKVTYTYKWYGNGQLLNETSDTLTASAEGSYYVEVTATDADGQTATAQSNPVYVYFDGQVMYRLYNPYNGEHLYTADTLERDVLDNIGWNYEGIGWIAPVYDASTPVYRLNNPFAPLGDHHYTTSLVEYEACIEAGWEGEGIAWYSADEETGVPIYRQYNPFASSGTHNYTADENERDTLVDLGWKDEGVAWYALK